MLAYDGDDVCVPKTIMIAVFAHLGFSALVCFHTLARWTYSTYLQAVN